MVVPIVSHRAPVLDLSVGICILPHTSQRYSGNRNRDSFDTGCLGNRESVDQHLASLLKSGSD